MILLGGERIAINSTKRPWPLHVFERSMSEERERLLQAGEDDFIDVWRLVTPMSSKQRARLDGAAPIPEVKAGTPPANQIDAIREALRLRRFRERANTRTTGIKVTQQDGDTIYEAYELGYGIRRVSTGVLWRIFDTLARNGVQEIDAADLSKLVTRRQTR